MFLFGQWGSDSLALLLELQAFSGAAGGRRLCSLSLRLCQ